MLSVPPDWSAVSLMPDQPLSGTFADPSHPLLCHFKCVWPVGLRVHGRSLFI